MGEVYEAFDRARRSRKRPNEIKRLAERIKSLGDVAVIGVGRDALPIVKILRMMGFDAYRTLPLSRLHPIAFLVNANMPTERMRGLILEEVRRNPWVAKQAQRLVEMLEEAAGKKRSVVIVDTGIAGTHPRLIKAIYEAMRRLGRTKKNLEIYTAVLGLKKEHDGAVDVAATILKGGAKHFIGRWESLPKFVKPPSESRFRAAEKGQTFPFDRFIVPFAKYVADVAGILARISPEAARRWVEMHIRYFQRLSAHPHFGIHLLWNDEVAGMRDAVLADLRRIARELEGGRESGRGRRRGGQER